MSRPVADHGFQRKLKESMQHLPRVREVLRRRLLAIDVEVADEADDRYGIDYWATLTSGERVGVDLKVRDQEYDDLLIETISNTSTRQVGWTIDPTKRTDFVLYLWPESEQLISYPQLRAAATENAERWTVIGKGGESTTDGGTYRTRWLALKDAEILAGMHYRRSRPRLVTESGPRCPRCSSRAGESQPSLDPRYTRHWCGRCRKWWDGAA